MEKITALILVLVSSSAFARMNGYDLKMEISMNGKHVSSPRVTIKEGQTGSITEDSGGEKIFMDVVATEKPTNNNQAILMKFVVGTISATGEKKIVSTPQIIALENQKAEITVGSQPEKKDLALSVIATRKAL